MNELIIRKVIGGCILSTPETNDKIFTSPTDILSCVQDFLKDEETMKNDEAEMQE